jgi:GT2 family glycosyltransferase
VSAFSSKVVSVVLNWNGWLDTIECVESLLRSDYANHQIVVCDNGSQDHSIERLTEWADGMLEIKHPGDPKGHAWEYRPVLKPLPYVLYESPDEALAASTPPKEQVVFIRNGDNLGYAGGNNIGMRFALESLHADYVWLLNNDTVVDRRAMSHLLEALTLRPDAAVLGSRLMQYNSPDTIQALGGGRLDPRWALDTQIGRGQHTHEAVDQLIELEHIIGASMFIRSDVIRDVGPIDESYFLYREETDWCIAMRKRGWRLFYCPQSIVWHKEGHSAGFKSGVHDYYAVRNMLYLIQKHYPQHLTSAFLISFYRAVAPKVARLQFRRLIYVLRAYVDFLRGVRGKTEVDPDLLFLLERSL